MPEANHHDTLLFRQYRLVHVPPCVSRAPRTGRQVRQEVGHAGDELSQRTDMLRPSLQAVRLVSRCSLAAPRRFSTVMSLQNLADGHCVPCSKKAIRELGIEKMSQDEVQKSLVSLAPGWALRPQPVAGEPQELPDSLFKVYRFKNFATAAKFAGEVGKEADAEGHHPAILLEWGSVAVYWWSHSLNGVCYATYLQLHHNDFVMAARTDRLAEAAEGLKSP